MMREDDKTADTFTEDEQPWRPADTDQVEPDPAEPDDRQAAPSATRLDQADEALEDVLSSPADDEPLDADDEGPDSETVAEDDAEPDSEQGDQTDMPDVEISTQSVTEAVLFSADEPIKPNKLAEIIGVGGVKDMRAIVDELNEKYERMDCPFRIETIAGGFQMLTLPQYNPWLRQLIKVRGETKLSPAALETLAIIAYKQPIMRVDIESIRGVAAGEMVRQLIDKGLVKIVGRAEELGRPLLYGTTRKFLECFGLSGLKDLPSAEDLKKPL